MSGKKKKQENPIYSLYGARISQSGKYVNLSLVNGEDDNKEWATACVKKKGKYIKVKINDDNIVLTIPRLDVEDDDEDDDKEDDRPLSDEGLTLVPDDQIPF